MGKPPPQEEWMVIVGIGMFQVRKVKARSKAQATKLATETESHEIVQDGLLGEIKVLGAFSMEEFEEQGMVAIHD